MGGFRSIVEKYILFNYDELEQLCGLKKQISCKNDIELVNRRNFAGHFTASAFVISKTSKRVMLIHHNFLKRYLQPGGHINENDINPLVAAKRELWEETGIDDTKLTYQCFNLLDELIPLNIEVQQIPENVNKKEPSHFHYDLQYLFWSDEDLTVTIDPNEVSAFQWVGWEQFAEMPEYSCISRKIKEM